MSSLPSLSVVAPLWQDRPGPENVEIGITADQLGFGEVWIGEMATYDSFALATAIGVQTSQIKLSLGPFAVAVRTPMTVAMGAASVESLTGRPVGVALGTSSTVVVEEWHGRSRSPSATMLAEHAHATSVLLRGERGDGVGEMARSNGYRLRLDPVTGPLTIAAFGPKAIQTAVTAADRVLLNMVTPDSARRLVDAAASAAAANGADRPPVALWLAASVDPSPAAIAQATRGLVGYLAAPGYGEMFVEAGFAELVEYARTRPNPKDLLAAFPSEATKAVGLFGSADEITERLVQYRDAGIDQICVVPTTADDDGARRTLTAFAELASS